MTPLGHHFGRITVDIDCTTRQAQTGSRFECRMHDNVLAGRDAAQDGETRHARLYFSDGLLRQVFGFTGEGGVGAPREIIPQNGDSFTVLRKWMDLDGQGKVAQTATQAGGTLVFGDQMFTWEELDAAAGEYIVGFIVEDLDGNANEVYEKVTVE